MKNTGVQYWTMFRYGDTESICSIHNSLATAKRAAKACEKRGGAKHWIVEVKRVA